LREKKKIRAGHERKPKGGGGWEKKRGGGGRGLRKEEARLPGTLGGNVKEPTQGGGKTRGRKKILS